MHNAAFRHAQLPWHYRLLPTPPQRLESTLVQLESLGYRGVNVTVPHKEAVIPHLAATTNAARAIGAINTIAVQNGQLVGDNTDCDGFLLALKGQGFDAAGSRALVLGAGGAARAVAFGLAKSGCSVLVHNRTPERARDLVASMRKLRLDAGVETTPDGASVGDLDLSRIDLLVNATSVGMWPETETTPWPLSASMGRHWLVVDLVYNPRETLLVTQARKAGAKTMGGLEMLVHQGALAFELWTGRSAPIEVMRKAAERALRR
jgi:shikimate dehydrogenase